MTSKASDRSAAAGDDLATPAKAGDLLVRAKRVLPGGVSSPVRSFRSVEQEPLMAARASGACVYGTDGRRYIDFVQSWGAMLCGHAHPKIVAAIVDAAPRGTSFGLTSPGEVELAEAILAVHPHCDRVRFVSSGTEAVMTAVRLARGATGRNLILRFDGGYHGHSDSMLIKSGSGLHEQSNASSAGVPPGLVADTAIVPLDDLAAVTRLVKERGQELAAILVEPVPANSGLLLHADGFLAELRRLTSNCGALLIFDEVITGFRIAAGGAREKFGVTPDLHTLGKIVGGGLPVGAVTGPAKLMDQLAPVGPVYQAGTLSGNPLAMAAGLASVKLATDPATRARLDANAAGLQKALDPVCAKSPFPLRLHAFGNMCWLLPQAGPLPRRPDQVVPEAKRRFNKLHARLRAHGVLLAPSLYEVGFVSTEHGADIAAETAQALTQALAELQDER